MIASNGSVDSIEHAERMEMLNEAMEQLSDQERLAIHLHYLDADPVATALPALGVSRSGFYKLLARARKRLASMLGAEASLTEPCDVAREEVA